MFQFFFSLFWKKSEIDRKSKAEKDKPVQSASGYVYTDNKANMRKAEQKKKTARH